MKQTIFASLQPFIHSGVLPGVVVGVADCDKILALESLGFASLETPQPMPTNAVFWVASQTKPVTATAIMMAVDDGLIDLDESVTGYLPEFSEQWLIQEKDEQHLLLQKPATPMTIRHLLCHCSGLPFSTLIEQPTLDLLPLCDAVRSYAMANLQSQPGTKASYSNAGVNTAARILEIVTGTSYSDFLNARIFEPLGMTDTTFWPNEEQLSRLAKSYKPNADKSALIQTPISQLRYPLNDAHRQPMPAGGLFSTTTDMLRFCQMHLNRGQFQGKRYITEQSWKEMTTRQTPADVPEKWGLGWWCDGQVFGHAGAYATHMSVDTGRGLVLVYHVQLDGRLGNADEAHAAFKQAVDQMF